MGGPQVIAIVLFGEGLTLIRLEKIEDAIDCFNKVLDNNPKNIIAWKYKGKALIKLTEFKEALNCFDTIIDIKKNYARTWERKHPARPNIRAMCHGRFVERAK